MGKNRTGLYMASFLIAFYCESQTLTLNEVVRYLCQLRPMFDFSSSDEFGCPMVPRGGDLLEKPVQSVERSNLYCVVHFSSGLLLHISSVVPSSACECLLYQTCSVNEPRQRCPRMLCQSRRERCMYMFVCSQAKPEWGQEKVPPTGMALKVLG